MYLKNIEVQGFKSFANKINFQFHNGITGIVGPNGSGKSNVADAVRWVLGEQRVKALRGGSMQDVIFAGTQTRKPMGYASVSITLDNEDHALPVSFDEVTVTRRLYRSGESEYLLNGSAVRLKDINELFFDTGVGKEGYSIIGQGQVETILNGKPEERRELFDEAAGIVKYKKRRQEARKKLENEQQNLIRIGDIVAELERRVGPLERQAEKAKVYLKKRDEMRSYDINLFLSEYQDAKGKLEDLKTNAQNASASLQEIQEQARQIRLEYDRLQEEASRLEGEHARLSEAMTDEKLRISHLEGQAQLLSEQIRQGKEANERQKQRLEELTRELLEKRQDEDAVSSAAKALKEQAEEISCESTQKEQDLFELQQELQAKEEEYKEEIRKRMMVIPTIIDDSVPIGRDDSENVEVERFGEPAVP
ncbi:MAG: AAA family ATPase, partial [Lachnospiraceae bacterium]|nr:AAA family ATPase [Lachnospiraceae bacterium]